MQHGQQRHLQYKVCRILYKIVSAPSFSQDYLCMQPALQSPPKDRSSTSVISTSYSTLNCSQDLPYNLHQNTFPLYLSNFSPPLFCVQPSKNSTPKIYSLPQPFCQSRLRQETRELRNLPRNDTVLISPFFLKVWTEITGLTTADYLSLRLRKLVYCRCGKPFNLPSFIPSTYCHYFHTLLTPQQGLAFP